MTTDSITLFRAIGAKMDYLNQRQSIISQNVANADTPGYKPKDIDQPDFANVLRDLTREKGKMTVGVAPVMARSTNGNHIAFATGNEAGGDHRFKVHEQKDVYEVSPSGNAVVIEEQLFKSTSNVTEYNLMSNLMQKQIGMLRMAIRSQ